MRHLVAPLIGRIRRECVFLRVGGGGMEGSFSFVELGWLVCRGLLIVVWGGRVKSKYSAWEPVAKSR